MILYKRLSEVYEMLEATSKRLQKTGIISEFLRELPSEDVDKAILLMQGKVFPDWDSREMGVASQTMIKAIALSLGTSPQKIEEEWKRTGDLGRAAENLVSKKSQHTLTRSSLKVSNVFDSLRQIAAESGASSTGRKISLLSKLLAFSEKTEAKYITRTVLGDLRVGVGEGVMRDGIVWATLMKVKDDMSKEEREKYNVFVEHVQNAFNLTSDFAEVYKASMKGIGALKSVKMSSEKPIKVMMALKARTAEEVFARVGRPAMAEFKYDGFRLEAVKSGGKIQLYTRRLENVSAQFPELVKEIGARVRGILLFLTLRPLVMTGRLRSIFLFRKYPRG